MLHSMLLKPCVSLFFNFELTMLFNSYLNLLSERSPEKTDFECRVQDFWYKTQRAVMPLKELDQLICSDPEIHQINYNTALASPILFPLRHYEQNLYVGTAVLNKMTCAVSEKLQNFRRVYSASSFCSSFGNVKIIPNNPNPTSSL